MDCDAIGIKRETAFNHYSLKSLGLAPKLVCT